MSSIRLSPNQREVLSAQSTITGKQEYLSSTNGILNISTGSSSIISTGNSTTTPLVANATFTGTFEDISGYAGVSILAKVDQDSATNGAIIDFSNDGITAIRSSTQTVLAAGGGLFFEVTPEGRYFRIRYTNGTVNQGTFILQTIYRTVAVSLNQLPIGATLTDVNTSLITRSVGVGKDPSGDYANTPASGDDENNHSTTLLTAGQTYTGTPTRRKGYVGIGITVMADQLSAANGLVVEHSDTLAFTTVRFTDKFTFGAAQVTDGQMFITLTPKSEYYRVKYTNGGTNQGSFYLATRIETTRTEGARQSVEGTLTSTSIADMGRNILSGKEPGGGTYANITRSLTNVNNQTGLHVAIQKHEVSTPILPLTTYNVNQVSVANTATAIVNPGTVGRKSIAIKVLSTQKPVFIGPTSGVTTGNGYELAAGESIVLEIDSTTGVWGISSVVGSQQVCFCEIS